MKAEVNYKGRYLTVYYTRVGEDRIATHEVEGEEPINQAYEVQENGKDLNKIINRLDKITKGKAWIQIDNLIN